MHNESVAVEEELAELKTSISPLSASMSQLAPVQKDCM